MSEQHTSDNPCYCGSKKSFSECCAPLITKQSLADTPEALMRSRFSAHCVGRWQYLLDTWHSDTKGVVDASNLQKTIRLCRWLGLEINDTSIDGDDGVVEFNAWYKYGETLSCLHERSQFKRRNGKWLYVEGDVKDREMTPEEMAIWSNKPVLNKVMSTEIKKVGRNDNCPCGSGKKYKKCCAK